jgi:hypothetical protein
MVEVITDAVAVVEFLTDIRQGEEEKPYSSIILYLIDIGFYQVILDALSDEHIQHKLSTLCARTLGNALTLENYPEIDAVRNNNKETLQSSKYSDHLFQCPYPK